MADTATDLLTVKQVAAMMQVSERTVWRWCEMGRLQARRMTGGTARFRRGDVTGAMDRFEYGGDAPRDPSMG